MENVEDEFGMTVGTLIDKTKSLRWKKTDRPGDLGLEDVNRYIPRRGGPLGLKHVTTNQKSKKVADCWNLRRGLTPYARKQKYSE